VLVWSSLTRARVQRREISVAIAFVSLLVIVIVVVVGIPILARVFKAAASGEEPGSSPGARVTGGGEDSRGEDTEDAGEDGDKGAG
jgi:hypothetical protein